MMLNQRQRAWSSQDARMPCRAGTHAAAEQGDPLLVAEELRLAMAALDAVVGRCDVEAMLDAVFSRFCVGK